MQTTLKYFFTALMACCLWACSEDNGFADTTLDISEQVVNLPHEASERSISVRTNANQWSASSAQEGTWFKLNKEGDRLSIKAEGNDMSVDRKAYIIIKAGNTVSKVELMQSAADERLTLESEEIQLSPNSTSRKLSFKSNVGSLKLQVENTPWLSVEHQQGDKFFTLKAEANEDLYGREGLLLVYTPKGVKSVVVKQGGTLSLIVPMLGEVTLFKEALRYELSKGNMLVQPPNGVFNKTAYFFYTGVKAFPQIEYNFKSEKSLNFKSVSVPTTNGDLFKGTQFEQFMASIGFNKTKTKPDRVEYRNDTQHFDAFVKYEADGKATLNFSFDPQQPQAYPTFPEGLPANGLWDYASDFKLKITGKKKDDVAAYEQLNKGVKNDELSKPASRFWFFEVKDDNPSKIVARAYKFYDAGVPPEYFKDDDEFVGQVDQLYVYYDNINLAYWNYDGEWKLTREFRDLLERQGIVFLREQLGHFFYYHHASKTGFDLTPMRFANFMQGKELLVIRLYRTVEDLPTN